jgi:hypothetical protein
LASKQNSVELAFTDVYSNNMALRREAYFEVGMMQDLGFPGSSMWCDIDLAYRAYQQGFDFRRSTQARCWHRDYFASSMDRYKPRIRTAAYRAVVLFQKYPELPPHLHMFSDKTPISWGQDPPRLIVRKLVRSMASSRPAMWGMEQLVSALEKRYPASRILPSLYRYIIGGNIFQGYREGLRKFGQVDHKDEPVLLAWPVEIRWLAYHSLGCYAIAWSKTRCQLHWGHAVDHCEQETKQIEKSKWFYFTRQS